MRRYDAVVVGAGPSGMLLWECLSDAGLDVLLIEAGPARCACGQPEESDRLIWQVQNLQWKAIAVAPGACRWRPHAGLGRLLPSFSANGVR